MRLARGLLSSGLEGYDGDDPGACGTKRPLHMGSHSVVRTDVPAAFTLYWFSYCEGSAFGGPEEILRVKERCPRRSPLCLQGDKQRSELPRRRLLR